MEQIELPEKLEKRKQKIGSNSFYAEFLTANYYYVERYLNYRCWEQLYFTAFLMSAYDLLDNHILTPEGLKLLAKGSTGKDVVEALTDASLYFAQCRTGAQYDGYKSGKQAPDSRKSAERKSVISVLKKGEKHPIFRASGNFDKKQIYSEVAHYEDGISFDSIQSEHNQPPEIHVGRVGSTIKKVIVFVGIISLHIIGSILVNMLRNAMINKWASEPRTDSEILYGSLIYGVLSIIPVVAYFAATTPLAIRYLIRYAMEN